MRITIRNFAQLTAAMGLMVSMMTTTGWSDDQTRIDIEKPSSIQRAAFQATDGRGGEPQIILTGGPPGREYYHGGITYVTDDYPTNCRLHGNCGKRRWWFRNWLRELRPKKRHYGEDPKLRDRAFAPFQSAFGYIIPTGCGGEGCPPFGVYNRIYAVNPYYTNGHDTKVYGAQGYGVPVSVPLAPVVRHAYNYGWGLPASRLTPISHMTPPSHYYGGCRY